MSKLDLSLACYPYDRVLPIYDGRVPVEGCTVNGFFLHAEESFHRSFLHKEFDVSELSMSSCILSIARGACAYVPIPVFVSRCFRHHCLYIRTDRGIRGPQDLKGRLVGVPEYQMTASLWLRGILSDQYGVRAQDIRWRSGGLNDAGRPEKYALALPAGFDVAPIPHERTLNDMFAAGDLDALVSPRIPACFKAGDPKVARMWPDFRAAEQDWFRKTGLFPIMHTIGIRRDLVERHPWLPMSVFKAFEAAKAQAIAGLDELGICEVTLPWVAAETMATREVMGDDYWPYGLEPNRRTLETMIRYQREQGLLSRDITLEEIFAEGTMDRFKV